MKRPAFKVVSMLLSLVLAGAGVAWAQAKSPANAEITGMLIRSYDLLEAGKLDQAQEIYGKVLQRDPGNPLALNNLGAIMVKKKKYDQALTYLQQALPRAKGYRVKVNRVCDVEGLCLAFRPMQEVYGDTDLEPLIQLNLELVKGKLAAGKE